MLAALLLGLGLAGLTQAAPVRGDELARAQRLTPSPQHGAQLFTACVGCHGADGGGLSDGSVPRIAGQLPGVIVKQLVDFRHGQRWDLRMEQVASHYQLQDAQALADVAGYVATLVPMQPPALGAGDELARGERLYVQRCAACHGASGAGVAATSSPRLAGQHATYLLRQMQEGASSGRPNLAADHVAVLNQLTVLDYRALADYLARVQSRLAAR